MSLFSMDSLLKNLKEISSAVMYAAEARDLEGVFQRIADAARNIAKTKYAALGIPDGKGGLTFFKTSGLTAEQEARIPHRPRGHGLIGAIMRERRVILLEHMKDDPRSYGFPENHPHMDSFLGAPIIVGNHLYGMIYLSDKLDGTLFTEDDQSLIEMLAGYAALAIAGAELTEQESRLTLLEERDRIGMELHDGVIQSLYGIGMQVDLLRRKEVEVGPKELNSLIGNLNNVIEDIRGFIANLRSRTDQKTIRETLEHLKERLHPPQEIEIEIDAPDGFAPFSPAVFESICLIANEAMSNAIRHSGATKIQVKVEQNKNRFNIYVIDNGRGFDLSLSDTATGLGLRNMRQRARLYGGEVSIESEVDKGTSLLISILIGAY
jgi:signal transduction histidine kinase